MPELPEVETVCRGLAPHLEGRRIFRVVQRRPDLRFPFPDNFPARLEGRRIEKIDRRSKYILIRLEGDLHWMVHLGMSGRFTVNPKPGDRASSGQMGHNSGWELAGKHDHVTVELEDGGIVTYNDPRRFGFMDLIEGQEGLAAHSMLADLGPEPLWDEFNDIYFSGVLKGKRGPIKAALLDQKLVAGLGNIYVCEALWRAGISPKRVAGTVAGKRAQRLVPEIKKVIEEAIAAGGSSLKDFVHADGELGYFQHNFDAYDREGEPCRRPGCSGKLTRIVQSGRSTFYCTQHQR